MNKVKSTTNITKAEESVAEAGKYLIFEVDGESYGIGILNVQEIIGMIEVTRVPKMPEYIQGVVNLRGKIIPVMDLRLKFGLDFREYTERTCIIVVQIGQGESEMILGIIVDEVSEVEDIDREKIDPPPQFGASIEAKFIMGLGKLDNRVVMLLDIEKIFAQKELEDILKVNDLHDQ